MSCKFTARIMCRSLCLYPRLVLFQSWVWSQYFSWFQWTSQHSRICWDRLVECQRVCHFLKDFLMNLFMCMCRRLWRMRTPAETTWSLQRPLPPCHSFTSWSHPSFCCPQWSDLRSKPSSGMHWTVWVSLLIDGMNHMYSCWWACRSTKGTLKMMPEISPVRNWVC